MLVVSFMRVCELRVQFYADVDVHCDAFNDSEIEDVFRGLNRSDQIHIPSNPILHSNCISIRNHEMRRTTNIKLINNQMLLSGLHNSWGHLLIRRIKHHV